MGREGFVNGEVKISICRQGVFQGESGIENVAMLAAIEVSGVSNTCFNLQGYLIVGSLEIVLEFLQSIGYYCYALGNQSIMK